jgi:hypothetical protein
MFEIYKAAAELISTALALELTEGYGHRQHYRRDAVCIPGWTVSRRTHHRCTPIAPDKYQMSPTFTAFKCYLSYGSLRTPNEKRSRLAPLLTNYRWFQTLDASIERYAQTKRLLTGSPFGTLKLLRDFARGCFSTSECLQGSYICRRPRTPLSVFHDLSLSCEARRLLQEPVACQASLHPNFSELKINGENWGDQPILSDYPQAYHPNRRCVLFCF